MNESQKLGARMALEQAIELAGSEVALARILEVTQGAINQRRRGGKAFLTAEQAVVVEQKLGLPRAISRPDLFEGIVAAEWDDGQFPIYAGDNQSLQPWGNLQAEIVDFTRIVQTVDRRGKGTPVAG